MAISTYDELVASIPAWLERDGDTIFEARVDDFITLGEKRLARLLPAVETDASLTGTADSRRLDTSALAMSRAIALFLVDGDEVELTQRADGSFPYSATSNRPSLWAVDGENIDFDCPLDQAYSFRLRYRERFALSADVPTNWLLTNHPDVYLSASLVEAAGFLSDANALAFWKGKLEEAIPEVRSELAQRNRSTLTVDPALSGISQRITFDGALL